MHVQGKFACTHTQVHKHINISVQLSMSTRLPLTNKKDERHLLAVVEIASTASMMRCSAVSVPMVMSVPQKSLSMEPTMPTMLRCLHRTFSSSVTLPGDIIVQRSDPAILSEM